MSPTARLKERIAELTRPTGEEDLMAVDYPKPRFSLSQTAAIAAAVFAVGILQGMALQDLEQRVMPLQGTIQPGKPQQAPRLPVMAPRVPTELKRSWSR